MIKITRTSKTIEVNQIETCCESMNYAVDRHYVEVYPSKLDGVVVVRMVLAYCGSYTRESLRYCPFCGRKINNIEDTN